MHIDQNIRAGGAQIMIRFSPVIELTEDQFFQWCLLNRELRIERTHTGEVIVMEPAGGGTGHRNLTLGMMLGIWARQNQSGIAFDSSTGFILPNSAMRSPDASWVRRERLQALTEEQKEKFLPLCPDFVIELRSRTDRLRDLQEKMQEYAENGVRLGWLIDPQHRRVYVYRPGHPVECLDNPATLSGDPELPGFTLNVREIWDAGF